MNAEPEIRYAKNGDVHIAYQVLGDGPIDIVVVPGFTNHLELMWENPAAAALWQRVASFARLILMDKRGTGLSDRVPNNELPNLEQRMDDVRAVMDSAGSERAGLLSFWEGGTMCVLFAATYPERTHGLILFATPMAFRRSPDYPWAIDDEQNEAFIKTVSDRWGRGEVYSSLAPSLAHDPHAQRWFGRVERMGASPGAVAALWRMNLELDARDLLPAVRVPTLVLHRRDDPMLPIEASRYLADRIPGAKLVELEGGDHLPWVGDVDSLVREVRTFLTGPQQEAFVDRVLATVLFMDIVGSTQRAAEVGDASWRAQLDGFYDGMRRTLERYRGQEVNTTGDGFLARFDGPARAIKCAEEISSNSSQMGMAVRAGLHTGECELRGDDIGGIAVHIGSRIADRAGAGEILVSSTVKDLVAGSGIEFRDRGEETLKGVPGSWHIYSVADAPQ
jgi:class 3 adenylate cyclase